MNDAVKSAVSDEAMRKIIAAAIFDPGATEGYKGERTLTDWQTDAVMRALTAPAQPVGAGRTRSCPSFTVPPEVAGT